MRDDDGENQWDFGDPLPEDYGHNEDEENAFGSGFSIIDADGSLVDELSIEGSNEDFLAKVMAEHDIGTSGEGKNKLNTNEEITSTEYFDKAMQPIEENDERYGGSTTAALQLGRIDGMSYTIQAGIKQLLSGQAVPNVSRVNAAAARKVFGDLIGMDTADFAKQIKVDKTVLPPQNREDVATMVSMLQNTSGESLDRGPGRVLVNNHLDKEKEAKADSEMLEAIETVKELTDLYIHPNTIGSKIESSRRKSIEEALIDRLINGASLDGSTSILPLPNETGVTGIRITQGAYKTNQGTPDDRVSASRFNHLYQHTIGAGGRTEFVRDENGHKIFKDDVTPQEKKRALQHIPSLMNSIIPDDTTKKSREEALQKEVEETNLSREIMKAKGYGTNTNPLTEKEIEEISKRQAEIRKSSRKLKYDSMLEKAQRAAKILREQMPTNIDEDNGTIRRTGWHKVESQENKDFRNLANEAAILELDWSAGQDLDIRGNVSNRVQAKMLPSINLEQSASILKRLYRTNKKPLRSAFKTEDEYAVALAEYNNPTAKENPYGHSFEEEYVSHEGGMWRPSEIKFQEVTNENRRKQNEEIKIQIGSNSLKDYEGKQVVGKGSDRGGLYGSNLKSEVQDYVDSVLEEKEENEKWTKEEKKILGQFTQGTVDWLNQRKGNITASAVGSILDEFGVENRALELAKERQGTADPFDGNAHTREGNEGEVFALHAFMRNEGKGLIMEEAFFETNEDLKGFGVSPDGRLYYEEKEKGHGSPKVGPVKPRKSAGLLELKYLSSGSLKGSLNKYMNQIQLQMAVTGETQTHFFALDKHTGAYVHELVKADKGLQKKLVKAGREAQALSKTLDEVGVQKLSNRIKKDLDQRKKDKKDFKGLSAREIKIIKDKRAAEEEREEGQTTSFEETEEDLPMVAYDGEIPDFVKQINEFANISERKDAEAAAGLKLTEVMKKVAEEDREKDLVKAVKAAVPSKEIKFTKGTRGKKTTANTEAVTFNVAPSTDFVGPQREMVSKVNNLFTGLSHTGEKWTPEGSQLDKITSSYDDRQRAKEVKDQITKADAQREQMEKDNKFPVMPSPTDFAGPSQTKMVSKVNSMFPAMGNSGEKWTPEGSALEEAMINKEKADQSKKAQDIAAREAGELTAKESKDLAKAKREEAEATRNASRQLQEFGKALTVIAGGVMSGNLSGMDEIRMAARTGQSEHTLRGMRKELEDGLLGKQGAQRALEVAGQQSIDFSNAEFVAQEVGRTMKAQAVAIGPELAGIKKLKLNNFSEMLGKDSNEIVHYHLENMKDLTPKERSYYANEIAQNPDLASFNYEKADYNNFANESYLRDQSNLMTERLQNTASGANEYQQLEREGMEGLGSIGMFGGFVAGGLATLGGLGVLNYTGKKLGKGFGKTKGAIKNAKMPTASSVKGSVKTGISNTAKFAKSSKAIKAGKTALNIAKATPMAIAPTVATMGVRHFGDVEDDGGLGDSLLDVAEFATYGAALGGTAGLFGGPLAPVTAPVGAAIGAAAGTAIGVGNELWEWATGDDEEEAIPSRNIGNMPSQTSGNTEDKSKVVNVEVHNSIAKDLVVTNTNVDGDLSVDTQSTKNMIGN